MRRSEVMRRCFSFVTRRRVAEITKDAATAAQAMVNCTTAMRLPIRRTNKGMQNGKTWLKISSGRVESCRARMPSSSVFHVAAKTATNRYGVHHTRSVQLALPGDENGMKRETSSE